MTIPIFARGISTKSDPACLFLVLSTISMIKARALRTASAVPATFTWHGSVDWSLASTLKAPLFSRISMIVCACFPITLPRRAFGTGTNSSTAGSRKMGTSSGGSSRRPRSSRSSRLASPQPSNPTSPPRGVLELSRRPRPWGGPSSPGGGMPCQPGGPPGPPLPPPQPGGMPGAGGCPGQPHIPPPGMPGHIWPCQPWFQTFCRQSSISELEEELEEDEPARFFFFFFFFLSPPCICTGCCPYSGQQPPGKQPPGGGGKPGGAP
mmetsp:Transcript_50156/g.126438  ORF Transcript_50156/g.126438 Transcript_50156/m.126438 type:complete len:265 (-) Transcript_50156:309-1103(-)